MGTIALHAAGPGKGGGRPLFSANPRPVTAVSGTFTFTNSYAAGGEALDFTSAGQGQLREVLAVWVEQNSGYQFFYDYTNKKVKAFWGDNNNASDGPGVEVADTTDLSTTPGAIRFIAFGYR